MQEESTGEITFYMKGADVAMASIVQYNDWLEEEVKTLSLLFPKREFTPYQQENITFITSFYYFYEFYELFSVNL